MKGCVYHGKGEIIINGSLELSPIHDQVLADILYC